MTHSVDLPIPDPVGVRYPPIEDYGVIGDLRTIALVGVDASIDFLCFPEFDSPTIFAALLDRDRGGHFAIVPLLDGARRKQLYLPDTNILVTRTLSDAGVTEIIDVMPVAASGPSGRLIRLVKTVRGTISYRMRCEPRFNYGREVPTITRDGEAVLFKGSPNHDVSLRLSSHAVLDIDDAAATAQFTLKAGETAVFVLEQQRESGAPLEICDAEAVVNETAQFWREWAGRSKYRGRWREIVNRSALVLKLLSSHGRGCIVAAGTFGLPERIGGERNWDYRFTWLRDSSFTVFALTRLGYVDEAMSFMDWLQARAYAGSTDGSLQVLYPVQRDTNLTEVALDHFEGYRGSQPVRIGNAAHAQVQLDIYGEMMDAVYLANKYGRAISYDGWQNILRTIAFLGQHWNDPDDGVWEVRSGRKHFLHSRLMCWVAVDRAIRMGAEMSLPAPLNTWVELRNAIHASIYADFWDDELQCFVQSKQTKSIDAVTLLMPITRFISPTDPRWLTTLQRIGETLRDDALVYRYENGEEFDGLRGREGSFTPCSFWFVECLARAGRLEMARLLFEKMLGYANHLGLYSEELGPSGEHLGNFPQAWTHLSLITAAMTLDGMLDGEIKPAWHGWR